DQTVEEGPKIKRLIKAHWNDVDQPGDGEPVNYPKGEPPDNCEGGPVGYPEGEETVEDNA
ncbi:hypothetical protein U1Q18_003716, partial [Sarracenia purpurea var. burkii]